MNPNIDEWFETIKEYQHARFNALVVVGTKDAVIPKYFEDKFLKQLICEPDPRYSKELADYSATTEYVRFSNNAVSNEETSILYVEKDLTHDTQRMYHVNSTTLDLIYREYKIQCLIINCRYFQKKILLGGVDVIRQMQPTIIIKKNREEEINREYIEILEDVFHYRKVYDKDGHFIYIHHSLL